MDREERFILEAIRLSEEGVRTGKGGPFGCVVVKDGKIIGRGQNRVTSTNDPTSHAEVNAIREACAYLGSFQLEGCEIYTSCEPCPMCLGAIYWARPKAIYFANSRNDAAQIGFDDSFIYEEIALPIGDRKIKMLQISHKGSFVAFDAWSKKQDKISY